MRTVKSVKNSIQKILLGICRARDGDCLMSGEGVGKCGGVTTADHIITRKYANTFADPDNVILVCFVHHLRWKPSNPTLYTEIVKRRIGEKRFNEIHEKGKILKSSMSLKDWLEVEKDLKEKAKEYTDIWEI